MFFTLRDIRKAALRIPILAALVWLSAGCKAKLPNQLASDSGVAIGCTIYADQLIAFNPPGGEGGSDDGNMALGAPDGVGVPMSTNAVLTVAFLGLGSMVDQSGDDLLIHGTLAADAEIAVYVGFGEGPKEFSGGLTGTKSGIDFEIATARSVSYIELVGISGSGTIDAFESLQTACP